MPTSRRMLVASLVLGASLMSQAMAQEMPPGVTLQLSGLSAAGLSDRSSALLDQSLTALRPVVEGRVAGAVSEALAPLMDELRQLPARLAEQAARQPEAWTTRYAFCVRLLPADGARLGGEAAVVDLAQARLLGYKTLSFPRARLAEELPAALTDLARELLPRARHAEPPVAFVKEVSFRGQGAAGDPGRDALEDAPRSAAVATPAALVTPRPQPTPISLPAENLRGDGDLDHLLRQFGGQALGLGGLGAAASRPRVVENSYELLLLPTRSDDPTAPPVRVVTTIYGEGDRCRLEFRFSRAVPITLTGRQGTWVVADIKGYRPEAENTIDVDHSGLIGLLVKPTDDGTRLGLRLAAVGEAQLEQTADNRILLATVYRSEERARQLEAASVSGDEPWGGNFHVVGSSSGMASWYGGSLHGGPTASGERFNQWGWTAAHKSLPLGSWVRVTNLRNGKAVYLRINDRGPFVRGRVIDVSAAAAQALDFYGAGVAPVQIDVLQPG